MADETTKAHLYHIATKEAWDDAVLTGRYRPESLHVEGFIHCSTARQVIRVADFLYQGRRDLVLLEINPDRVGPEIRYETAETGESFPHVYGAINLDAVVQILPFEPRPDGGFDLPAGVAGNGTAAESASAIVIDRLDHLVLTVADIDATCRFYTDVLGMRVERFGEGRTALRFGFQKINLHQRGAEIDPHAAHPLPGSADLCLLTLTPMSTVAAHLQANSVDIVTGPVRRTGAIGPIESIYFRDPDGNLIEVSNRVGE
jgi:uncharacterized protein (DUF952 family)/catechol 2,3-dioxygenase-like lactoylglutathione lyase family enzyme